jgi:hypothetical protein
MLMKLIKRKKNENTLHCPECDCWLWTFGKMKEYVYCPLCKRDYEVTL